MLCVPSLTGTAKNVGSSRDMLARAEQVRESSPGERSVETCEDNPVPAPAAMPVPTRAPAPARAPAAVAGAAAAAAAAAALLRAL